MTDPGPLVRYIEQDQRGPLEQLIGDQPRRVHVHTPFSRPWGDEMWLPLHHAARLGRVEIARALLDAGAAPDSRTRYASPDHARATALHLAAACARPAVVDLLLNRGAEVEVRDAYGFSPVHLCDHPSPAAELLLAAGADRDAPRPDQPTQPYLMLLG